MDSNINAQVAVMAPWSTLHAETDMADPFDRVCFPELFLHHLADNFQITFNMLFQVALLNCLIITMITEISDISMYGFNVSGDFTMVML